MKIQSQKQKKKHIQIGDKVKVLSGDQKGLIGNILNIEKKNQMVLLDSSKTRSKYLTKREKEKLAGSQSEDSTDTLTLNKKEIPVRIHISNLMLWDSVTNIASRIGYKILEKQKVRYFKKSGNVVSKSTKTT